MSQGFSTTTSINTKAAPIVEGLPEVMDTKVRLLLNQLTVDRFDTVSDEVIAVVNRTDDVKDGRILRHVTRLVFERAIDDERGSAVWARLCRKMMEQVSPNVQDNGFKNSEGKPITGGHLFRSCLLALCKEKFQQRWTMRAGTQTSLVPTVGNAEDQAANATVGGEINVGQSRAHEDDDAHSASFQNVGFITFVSELFRQRMLTERVMHKYVKALLANVEGGNADGERIECLCALLRTVGANLDTRKARAHMNVYFARIGLLNTSQGVTPIMQAMLQVRRFTCALTRTAERLRRTSSTSVSVNGYLATKQMCYYSVAYPSYRGHEFQPVVHLIRLMSRRWP